jgi:outer membrane murein-binding lipoprotein Lpp
MPQETNMAELLRLMHKMIVKFDGVDSKVGGLDRKFDSLDGRVIGLDQKFDSLGSRVDGLDQKVDILATDMKEVKSDVHVLKSDVKELKTGVARVEGKVDLLGAQFQDVTGVVLEDVQRITSLEGRVYNLESKSH